ncbi:hypothetical protein [Haladaptatus sp. DJG-WS-42]|uniref:hypothetical protein n=1 Tax=Haladaptatus sp. DJG-WS-42 TaxID=3120516 RepID=UPI0030D0A355
MKTNTRTLSATQYAYRRPAQTKTERVVAYLRAGVIVLALAVVLAVLALGVISLLPAPAVFVLGMVALVSGLILVPFAAIKLVVGAIDA